MRFKLCESAVKFYVSGLHMNYYFPEIFFKKHYILKFYDIHLVFSFHCKLFHN